MANHKRTTSPRAAEPPKELDLAQFSSLEDAIEKVQPGDRYLNIGSLLLGRGDLPLTLPVLFFFSMISRSEGLHGAIAREAREGNPHAVFPLIRAFAESVTHVLYVTDHPEYIRALMERPQELPKTGPRRKSMQKLIAHVTPEARGLKEVYSDLSEATHLGSFAFWNAVAIEEAAEGEGSLEDGSGPKFSWQSTPRWRSDEQGLIACALTLELAEGMDASLRRFAARHLGLNTRAELREGPAS